MPTAHLPILKRAGVVLLSVGILDIGLMIYAIASQVSYSSSLNLFAVIAGVFLLRGSLRAAAVVRWFALFLLAALVSGTLVAPILQPLDLTLTQFQINPLAFLGSLALFAVGLALFAWLGRELGSPPVQLARKTAGLPVRRPGIPVALGVTLAVVLAVVSLLVQRSESAVRAVQEARATLGDEYVYHVSSLNYRSSTEGKLVSGVVTAWKSGSVKSLPFHWRE
jgi:hypothetical protein